MQDKHPTS